jgi:hypothetical protein
MCPFDFGVRKKQQPAEHALHIFQLNVKGPVQKHRALNPLGAQMQITDLAVFGEIDFGQVEDRRGFFSGHGA